MITQSQDKGASLWLREFQELHGRPLRILHIGNIANNAYLNSKILRRAGVDSDVLCYDYWHIMGCPEWEDADFLEDWKDDSYPAWHRVDLRGFSRPEWFIQGRLKDALRYIAAKKSGNLNLEKSLSTRMAVYRVLNCYSGFRLMIRIVSRLSAIQRLVKEPSRAVARVKRMIGIRRQQETPPPIPSSEFGARVHQLLDIFHKEFPLRKDKLYASELMEYQNVIPWFKEALEHYDLVHAYATDGIYPLLLRKPFVAYEHGTIRSIPFEETTQGRLCALTYKEADFVAITNCDAIHSAQRLGIDRYAFVPHPINEDWLHEDDRAIALREELRSRLDSDFVVFHPSRQHWEEVRHPSWEKGNDFFIRGLARFVNEVNPRASCVMVEWGKTLPQSRQLIRELGIEDRVLWVKPQPNRNMIRYIMATDALADQFFLGAFGSTTPKALALGRPVFLYLNEDVHRWCFDEMPPVLNAQSPEDIFRALKDIYMDPEYYRKLSEAGRDWYRAYHSNKTIGERLIDMYASVITSQCDSAQMGESVAEAG